MIGHLEHQPGRFYTTKNWHTTQTPGLNRPNDLSHYRQQLILMPFCNCESLNSRALFMFIARWQSFYFLSVLQSDLDEKLVGFNLMSETFTMGQLQKLYEAVYQKKFVRTNFQRKILSLNVLERLEKQYNGKSHKAPYFVQVYKTQMIHNSQQYVQPPVGKEKTTVTLYCKLPYAFIYH